MHFGVFDHMESRGIPLGQLYDERLAYLRRLDDAGFWGYFKSEHHLTPLDAAPCQSVLLAAAAQHTRRIHLVPLVYLLPFHHPIRLAEEISMLDHLTGGRLEVGVGRGIAPPEHEFWGHDPDTARERSEETLEVLLRALTTDRLSHDGTYWHFHEVPIELHCLQRPYPPLWYPGNVAVAAPRGFNTVVGGPITVVARQVARYWALYEEHGAAEHGVNRHLGRPTIAATRHIFVADTDDEAVARARGAWAAFTHNISLLWRRAGIEPSAMPSDPSAGGDFDRALSLEICLAGSPERIAAYFERFAAESGVDHAVLSFAWGDLSAEEFMPSLDLFVSEVMPRFRGRD